MGDQVREETIYAKFGADQCTWVFGRDMLIFGYHFLRAALNAGGLATRKVSVVRPSVCLSNR